MNKLFSELRRRNVFRVAGVYAVIAWLLIQVVVAIKAPLSLPAWTDTLVIVLFAIGFPIALILAWAFEMTPEGMKLTAAVPEGESIAPKTGRALDYVIIGGLALVGVMIVADRMTPEKATVAAGDTGEAAQSAYGAPSAASIAVLPFADLSPAGDQEYFSQGIAEEILNVLANVSGLEVASRTSSFQFKGREIGIPEIARQLDVRHVLEGSVRKAGDTIRITAQLIDTQTDRHLWSETFDRPLTTHNVFTIQDEIANAIVNALDKAMGVETAPTIAVAPTTDNLTAYDLYLQARALFQSRTRLDEADALLTRAVEQDQGFAKAWEMRAALQALLVEYGFSEMAGETVDERTAEYAERALAVDARSAMAIASLAKMRMHAALQLRKRGDFAEIIADFDRALAIEPRNASALNWRGSAHASVGALEKAREDYARCTDFEPDYVPCAENYYAILGSMGRDAEALAAYKSALDRGAAKIVYAPFAVLARQGEELAFKIASNAPNMLFGWTRHDELYEAYRHPDNVYPELIGDIVRFQEKNGQMTQSVMEILLQPLGAFEYDVVPYNAWDVSSGGYRQSAQFKNAMRKTGIIDYWRTHGFPPQCRPVVSKDGGKDDFKCE